jgi:3-deoxy-D-manno-octulosonic-acid transferase
MTYLIYDILLFLATPGIMVYSLFRAWRRNRRREGMLERCGIYKKGLFSSHEGMDTIWIHAVSVGETIAVHPLLKALKERFPGSRIVLSNVTETGHGIAQKIREIDTCIYFPFDYPLTVKRALRLVCPSLVIIVETEIWPNFLKAAKGMGIPVILVNGRISDRSFGRYMRLKWFFRPVLANIAAFCMQTAEDARRITAMGSDPIRVSVTGNLKYDIPVNQPSVERKNTLRKVYRIPDGMTVITAGSTHAGEEETVLSAYRRILEEDRECLLVLVPRHPERAGEVAGILDGFGMGFTLRSRIGERTEEFREGQVLLVDTVGELMGFYAISELVFVGGSLVPTGGHNILEPASLGVPVLFGPHMNNFRESASLILACGGGLQIRDGADLASNLSNLMENSEKRLSMGENGMRLVMANSGAAERQMEVIRSVIRGAG